VSFSFGSQDSEVAAEIASSFASPRFIFVSGCGGSANSNEGKEREEEGALARAEHVKGDVSP